MSNGTAATATHQRDVFCGMPYSAKSSAAGKPLKRLAPQPSQ